LVKGGTVYRLTDNYRSTQEILDIGEFTSRQSPLPYNKKLAAIRGMGQAAPVG
jgi:DNA helicase-2/ATP-dependent DNA helicase PcrA